MEAEEFVQLWHASFGPETQPPESCSSSVGKLTAQDVATELRAREARVEILKTQLKRERRALGWLRRVVAELERRTGANDKTCRPLVAAEAEDSADTSASRRSTCDKQPTQQSETCRERASPTSVRPPTPISGEVKSKHNGAQVCVVLSSPRREDVESCKASSKSAPVSVNSGETKDKRNSSRESIIRERFVHRADGTDKRVDRAVSKRLIEQGKWWSSNLLSLDSSTAQAQTPPPTPRKRCDSDPPEYERRVKSRPIPVIKVHTVVKDFEKSSQAPAQQVQSVTVKPSEKEASHVHKSTTGCTALETVNENPTTAAPVVEKVKVTEERGVVRPVIHLTNLPPPVQRTRSYGEAGEKFQFPGCSNDVVYSTHSLNRRSLKSRLHQLEEEGRVSNTLKRRSISIEAKLADRRKTGGWKVIEVSGQKKFNGSSQNQENQNRVSNRVSPNRVSSSRRSPEKAPVTGDIVVKEEETEVVREAKTLNRVAAAGMSNSKPSVFKAAKEKLTRVTSSPPLRRRPSRGQRGRPGSEGSTQQQQHHHRSSNGQVLESAGGGPAVQEVMVEKRVERSESLLSEIMSHRFSNGMEGSQLLESGDDSLVGGGEGGGGGGGKSGGEGGTGATAEGSNKVILRRRSERDNDPLPEAKRRSSYLEDDDCTTPKEDFSMSLNSEDSNMQHGITKTMAETASTSTRESQVRRPGSDATLRQESFEATLTPASPSTPGNVNFRMSYTTAVHDSPQMMYTAAVRDSNQVDYMPLIDEREGELSSSSSSTAAAGGRLQVVSSEPNLLELDHIAMLLEDSMELDEATISAVTLNNDMFGSRSGSVTSLPENLEDSQSTSTASLNEPSSFLSPLHPSGSSPAIVNLRQSGGSSAGSAAAKRRNRRREGNAELDDQTGASLEEMLTSGRFRSPSNASRSNSSAMSGVTEEVIVAMGQSPSATPTPLFSPTHCSAHLQEGEVHDVHTCTCMYTVSVHVYIRVWCECVVSVLASLYQEMYMACQ